MYDLEVSRAEHFSFLAENHFSQKTISRRKTVHGGGIHAEVATP